VAGDTCALVSWLERHLFSFQAMSPIHHFNTSPPVGSANTFTALVYGDMGVSPVPRAYKTAEYATQEAMNGTAAFVFHNGDISYARGFVSVEVYRPCYLGSQLLQPIKLSNSA